MWDFGTTITGGGDANVSGNVHVDADVTAGNLGIQGGTILDDGNLIINTSLDWFKGRVEAGAAGGELTLANGSTSELGGGNGAGPCVLSEVTLTIQQGATVYLSGPIDFQLEGGPVIDNYGTFNITDDSNIMQSVGLGATLNNYGDFDKADGGSSTIQFTLVYVYSGEVELTCGDLAWTWEGQKIFNQGGTFGSDLGGDVTVQADYEQDSGETLATGGTNFSISGSFLETGGDAYVSGDSDSGTGGVLSVSGNYELDDGTMNIEDKISELTICGDLLQAGGIFNLDGGGLWVGGDIQVGADAIFVAAGTITGNVTVAGTFNAQSGGGVGTLALTGNLTQTAGGLTVGPIPFTASGSFQQDGGQATVAGSLQANQGITLAGGTCTISGGALVGEVLVAAANGSLPGGYLVGAGTVQGDLTNSATLAVGLGGGTGTLIVTGNFTQTASGTLYLDLASNGYDVLQVQRTAYLGGALVVGTVGGFQPGLYQNYYLVPAGGLAGGWASVSLPSLSQGYWVQYYTSQGYGIGVQYGI